MPVEARYMSVDEFKARADVRSSEMDAQIGVQLDAASRQIDGFCGQSFGKSDELEDRIFYFDATSGSRFAFVESIIIDDFVSISAIYGDDGTGNFTYPYSMTGLHSLPRNAAQQNKPYHALAYSPGVAQAYTYAGNPFYGAKFTGIWGWPTIPAPVVEVTFQLANRLKTMVNAPFGISGSEGELGSVHMTADLLSPQYRQLLGAYRKLTI